MRRRGWTGEATGEAKAIDAPRATAIMNAYGLMPSCADVASAIGAISTVVAVLDSTCVKSAVSRNSPPMMTRGSKLPSAPVTPVATMFTRPALSSAVAIGSIPATSTMLFQSTDS